MKVKELVAKLLECDQELPVAYEHCYVDYVEQLEHEGLVEMGDLRPIGYTRWLSMEKCTPPDDTNMPFLIAIKEEGNWKYYLSTDFYMGLGTAAKRGALWMPIERTTEDKYKELGITKTDE